MSKVTPVPPSLARSIQDGRSFQTFAGRATLRSVSIAPLLLPSASLLVADPQFLGDARPLSLPLTPGEYPLILTLARYADGDERIASARLQITAHRPRQFAAATPHMIGIDSGAACFVDASAARRLVGLGEAAMEKTWAALSRSLDRNYADTRSWGQATIDSRSGANLVAFSSGFGAGGYGIYVGQSPQGQPACIVIDFGLLLTRGEIDEMGGDEGPIDVD